MATSFSRRRIGSIISPAVTGIVAAVVLGALFAACATSPYTGRQTLNLVPDSQLLKLSFDQYRQTLAKAKLSTNKVQVAMVRRVGRRIAAASEELMRERGQAQDIKSYKWEFNLIEDDDQVNAWAMPGGKIAVYTGILPVAKGETGLAVVMGHEVAHAIAKHGNERLSQGLLAQMGGMALSAALSGYPAQTQNLFMTAYGAGAQVGFLLPYSRTHELEADRIGLILTARAGYDPREAIPFWQRMAAQGGSRPPEFLSTHPTGANRIRQIRALMPEAMRYYRPR